MAGYRSVEHQGQVTARIDKQQGRTSPNPYPAGSQAAAEFNLGYNGPGKTSLQYDRRAVRRERKEYRR